LYHILVRIVPLVRVARSSDGGFVCNRANDLCRHRSGHLAALWTDRQHRASEPFDVQVSGLQGRL